VTYVGMDKSVIGASRLNLTPNIASRTQPNRSRSAHLPTALDHP
jgi:hypothetical protein